MLLGSPQLPFLLPYGFIGSFYMNTTVTTDVPRMPTRQEAPLPSRGRRIPEHYWGYLLLAPAVAMVLALILYPVIYSGWLSFHFKHAYLPLQTFIGLEYYRELLLDGDGFWRSVYLGAIYGFGSSILQIILGLSAALMLNESFFGKALMRGVALFPYMVPTVVVAILMKWILNDAYGILPYVMDNLGIGRILWFGSDWVMVTVILVSTWTFFPFVVIGTLARLQTIDPELYSAAKVDGAGVIRRFWHVTLPQLANVLFVVILLRTMFMFTKFDVIWLITGSGGIGFYTKTLPIHTFMKTFGELQVGASAALSMMMFLMLVVFALIYFKLYKRDEHI